MKKIDFSNPYSNNLLNKVLYSGISFVANAILTRYLGTTLKGDYTWILNTANLISVIAGLGIYQSIPFFNRQKDKQENIIPEYIDMFCLQFLIYAGISAILLLIRPSALMASVLILANLDMFSQQLNMLMLISDIYKRNRIFLLGAVTNFLLSVLAIAVFQKSLYIAVSIAIAIKVFYVIGYLIVVKIWPRPFRVNLKNMAEKIKFGYLPMLSFLLISLNYKVDVLMLKAETSVSAMDLSLYSVGVSIAELAWFIPDVFKEVVFSKTAHKNHYEEIASVIRISNLVMLTMIGGVLIFGKLFIHILYGKDFVDSYYVTAILFLGIPAMSWFKIIYTLFNAQGKRKLSFSVLLLSAVSNIILNYVTIPLWGIKGAAMASVSTYLICGIIFLILFGKIAHIKLKDFFLLTKKDFRLFR